MLQNLLTPRVFIAATRQNDGKTTTSLGLLAALQRRYGRVGYIKPVGQRFVEIDEQKIDEDAVIMDRVFRLNCPLVDMSPIAVEPDFTRKYLQSANLEALVKRIHKAFDRVAWEKDFVLCEGTGHAGVGSVFDLSNANVAKLLNAKVVIVTRGGIGQPIDETVMNHALFKQEGVQVIGVIINKVLPEKLDYITEFTQRGLKRKGLELLGVVPYQPILSRPTLGAIADELEAEILVGKSPLTQIVNQVVIGAMGAERAKSLLKPNVVMIVPADREDILNAATEHMKATKAPIAGIVLSDDIKPTPSMLKQLRELPCPVIITGKDSYNAASVVHDLIVKTRPDDSQKIQLIQEIISKNVNLNRILNAL
jgi:BioD-like phosphotransacetylase family protein